MTPDLTRIAAALNAYPWTPGAFSAHFADAPRYCAIGLLLRYAGVAQPEVACIGSPSALWRRYGMLLQVEYGIPDLRTAIAVMQANDGARSHAEAIERVLGVLTGASVAERSRAFAADRGDDAGSLALLA